MERFFCAALAASILHSAALQGQEIKGQEASGQGTGEGAVFGSQAAWASSNQAWIFAGGAAIATALGVFFATIDGGQSAH